MLIKTRIVYALDTYIRGIQTWVNWRNNVDMLCSTSFSLSLSMLASNLDNSVHRKTITKHHWKGERQVSEQWDQGWVSLILASYARSLQEILSWLAANQSARTIVSI